LPFCGTTALNCTDAKYFSLNYNCIGWALGIRDWINPQRLGGKPVLNTEKELNSFLDELRMKYPDNHEKNILGILNHLHIKKDGCINKDITAVTPKSNLENDNTILFYFTGELTHAARYVNNINNQTINSYTSKLGEMWLISHTTSDLSDMKANAAYGLPKCISYEYKETNWHEYTDLIYMAVGVSAVLGGILLAYKYCTTTHEHIN